MPWKCTAESKITEKARNFTNISNPDRCLLVVFGIQNLSSTHCKDAGFVSTALTVIRTGLGTEFLQILQVEISLSIWIGSCFLLGWKLYFSFSFLPPLSVVCIPYTIFPCIWSDNSTESPFTFSHTILLWWVPLATVAAAAAWKHPKTTNTFYL